DDFGVEFLYAHWIFICIGIAAFFFALATLIISQKRAIVRLMLSLPGLRRIGRSIDLMRLTRSFGLLMHAGVPLEESLNLTKKVVQNKKILESLHHMETNLDAGKPLSDGLRDKKGIIPPMMVRSIETAETSGTLEETMQNLSR